MKKQKQDKTIKLTRRDVNAITNLIDSLSDWSDNFVGKDNPYRNDWFHYHNKTFFKLEKLRDSSRKEKR